MILPAVSRSRLFTATVLVTLGLHGLPDPASATRSHEGEFREHIEYLASDELEGRETGAPGCERAEDYIAASFAASGLAPLPGEVDLFLDFELFEGGFDPDRSLLRISREGRHHRGEPEEDFRPFPFSDAGAIEGEVVFAGYGITAPEHDYDDYRGLDVEDKIVLVLRYEPGADDPDSPFDGEENSTHALFRTKADNALRHGALGMLLVTGRQQHTGPEDLGWSTRLALQPSTRLTEDRPFLAAQIGQEMAERLTAAGRRDLFELQAALERGEPASSLQWRKVRAELRVEQRSNNTQVRARNVVGWLEGSDPRLRDEWILVGAHHDHIGTRDRGDDRVYNGADDNASGTSMVMALARAWAELEPRPRRSVVFATFSGEERGLLGSRAIVDLDLLPMERVRFMVNLDMVGRNPDQPLLIEGDGHARGLRELVEAANAQANLELSFRGQNVTTNSDHATFFAESIPVLSLFSGFHDDYHGLRDHPGKIVYPRLVRIHSLLFETLRGLADRPDGELPGFLHVVAWLGMRLELDRDETSRVLDVEEGSRAARAGLAPGDRVLAVNGDSPRAPVGALLRDVDPEEWVELVLERNGEQRSVELRRARPGFLGIVQSRLESDRRDELRLGDDEGLLVDEVLEDGPAAEAGLRPGDVVIRVAGRAVLYENLVGRLSQIGAGEDVELVVLRRGERLTITVTLGERVRQG